MSNIWLEAAVNHSKQTASCNGIAGKISSPVHPTSADGELIF
jgi:hypothetical protein